MEYKIENIKNKILQGETLEILKKIPSDSIDTIITSPPYWNLRSYLPDNHPDKSKEIGLEKTLEEYLKRLLKITKQLRRVLKPSGTLYWNHADSYATMSGSGKIYENIMPGYEEKIKSDGLRHNKLLEQQGIPRKSLFLQNFRLITKMVDEQEWVLRDIIIWAKKIWIAKENKTIGGCMPSSVKDRRNFSFEPVFMLVKNQKYWYDQDAVKIPYTEPLNRWGGEDLVAKGESPRDEELKQEWYRNRKMRPNPLGSNPPNVFQINTEPSEISHYAQFPSKLLEPLIKSSCPLQVCQKCGKPRERITEKQGKPIYNEEGNPEGKNRSKMKWNDSHPSKNPRWWNTDKTIGWTKCSCKPQRYEAGVVLDPFGGSMTTALVAKKLGRNWIMIELNPEYCRIGKERIDSIPEPMI